MSARTPSFGVWIYSPSSSVAIVATVLFAIVTIFHCFLSIFKFRSWYFIWVFIGSLLEVIGYASRVVSTRENSSVGPFIIQSTLIILAPLFVAAGNYLLLSRLVRALLPEPDCRFLGLKSSWLSSTFVMCDIITFLIQATGAAIVASGISEGSSVQGGQDILIFGLSVQVVTFAAFIVICWQFHRGALASKKPRSKLSWIRLLSAIYLSSFFIMIRTLYRLIEFALGVDGYPFTHEWIFYVFESLPVLLAISVFCVFHPGKYLPIPPQEIHDDEIELPRIA